MRGKAFIRDEIVIAARAAVQRIAVAEIVFQRAGGSLSAADAEEAAEADILAQVIDDVMTIGAHIQGVGLLPRVFRADAAEAGNDELLADLIWDIINAIAIGVQRRQRR